MSNKANHEYDYLLIKDVKIKQNLGDLNNFFKVHTFSLTLGTKKVRQTNPGLLGSICRTDEK